MSLGFQVLRSELGVPDFEFRMTFCVLFVLVISLEGSLPPWCAMQRQKNAIICNF